LFAAIDRWFQTKHESRAYGFHADTLRDLLLQPTMEQFDTLLRRRLNGKYVDSCGNASEQWQPFFIDYFKKQILPDIENIAYYSVKALCGNLFNDYTGITTNQAEGMNNLIKALIDRKELTLDMICLSLYQLIIHYCNIIKRGMCNEGEYVLKSLNRDCKMNSSSIKLRESMSPTEIIECLSKSVHLGNVEEFIVSDSDSSIESGSSESNTSSYGNSSEVDASFEHQLNVAIDSQMVENLNNLNLGKRAEDSPKSSTLVEKSGGADDPDKSMNEADKSFGDVDKSINEEDMPSVTSVTSEPKVIVSKNNS
jgi:hypothetical protein